jgi:hypothetical protein
MQLRLHQDDDLPDELPGEIESLLNIALAEQANIPEGAPAQIDVNIVNAMATYAIGNPQRDYRRQLRNAVILGGGRVFRAIDPDLTPPVTAAAVDALKLWIVGNLPGQAGGHRNSFKRRRGKTPKKTRHTRRA